MGKDIFTIRENTLSYGRGYVYSLQYHLVWCTKYRKKVLTDGLDTECKEMLQKLAEEYRFQILAKHQNCKENTDNDAGHIVFPSEHQNNVHDQRDQCEE